MAKMRVHELAKELNIKSQDILDKLKNTKFDGKSASSNMEEEAQALVRGAFSKEAKPAADVKKTEVAKAGATKTALPHRLKRDYPLKMEISAGRKQDFPWQWFMRDMGKMEMLPKHWWKVLLRSREQQLLPGPMTATIFL